MVPSSVFEMGSAKRWDANQPESLCVTLKSVNPFEACESNKDTNFHLSDFDSNSEDELGYKCFKADVILHCSNCHKFIHRPIYKQIPSPKCTCSGWARTLK